jgi:hypothetical protein
MVIVLRWSTLDLSLPPVRFGAPFLFATVIVAESASHRSNSDSEAGGVAIGGEFTPVCFKLFRVYVSEVLSCRLRSESQ